MAAIVSKTCGFAFVESKIRIPLFNLYRIYVKFEIGLPSGQP
jgi:hypothetical protein